MSALFDQNRHSWAQTIANAFATLVAIVALAIAVESDRTNLERDEEARINDAWLAYLEQQAETYDALEWMREQGANPIVTWKSGLEVRNLLARLEYIYSSTESKLWQERVEQQVALYATWLCVEPRLDFSKESSSKRFQQVIVDVCTPRAAR